MLSEHGGYCLMFTSDNKSINRTVTWTRVAVFSTLVLICEFSRDLYH